MRTPTTDLTLTARSHRRYLATLVDPPASSFHIASFLFIGDGFVLIFAGWRILYQAQRAGRLADTGI